MSLSLARSSPPRGVSPLLVMFVWLGSTGATFTSFTVTLKLFVALKLPSLTTVVSV